MITLFSLPLNLESVLDLTFNASTTRDIFCFLHRLQLLLFEWLFVFQLAVSVSGARFLLRGFFLLQLSFFKSPKRLWPSLIVTLVPPRNAHFHTRRSRDSLKHCATLRCGRLLALRSQCGRMNKAWCGGSVGREWVENRLCQCVWWRWDKRSRRPLKFNRGHAAECVCVGLWMN